jgi:nitrate/nitrite transporter NarK
MVFWIALAAALCLTAAISFALFMMRRQEQNDVVVPVTISGVLKFPRIFWLLLIYMGLFFCVITSFFVIASGLTETRFGLSTNEAGLALVLSYPTIVPCTSSYNARQCNIWLSY